VLRGIKETPYGSGMAEIAPKRDSLWLMLQAIFEILFELILEALFEDLALLLGRLTEP